tara:strand:- start:31723 stop:31923 length:201 start_codon:yes stop_codon:yes gene_type:complete
MKIKIETPLYLELYSRLAAWHVDDGNSSMVTKDSNGDEVYTSGYQDRFNDAADEVCFILDEYFEKI